MAFVGFGGFNRANQAAILQQQIRQQLGIPAGGLGLSAPGAPGSSTNNPSQGTGGVLGAQIADQQKAQQIMREIALEQQFVQARRNQAPQTPPQSQVGRPQGPNTMMQMGFMLNMLMMTMMAFAQMGNGFATFMGGHAPYPQYPTR